MFNDKIKLIKQLDGITLEIVFKIYNVKYVSETFKSFLDIFYHMAELKY